MKKVFKILVISLVPFLLFSFNHKHFVRFTDNDHISKKGTKKWEVLFDGSGVDKWRGKTDLRFPAKGWKVENGLLFLEERGGGDIITKEKYGSFDLIFEFNLTNGANSGIKYFVDTLRIRGKENIVVNGPEYQIIDDYNNSQIKKDPNGLSSTASAYLLYSPKNKKLNPPGDWNVGRILVKGNKVEHWLNGKKVLTYYRGSRDFFDKKEVTKFKDIEKYGELESGHILITDHSDKVYFRNIKIKRL